MGDYKIKILYEAYTDLDEYVDYIERMTFSKQKANEELSQILGEIMKLNFMPYMYSKVYKDFHILNFRKKRIFYKIDDKEKLVIIFKILGQSQNYEKII